MPYAPERFQLEIPMLSPWLAEERPGTKYLGPNIDWANIPGNILSLLNLADPSGMMAMAPGGFISSPKGLGFPLGKKIKLIKEVVTKGKKLSPAEIAKNKEIFDLMKSEVQKVIRSGKTGPSRKGGGLLDLLKDERGSLWRIEGRDVKGEIADFEKAMAKPLYPSKPVEEMLGNDLVREIAANGYSPEIRAKILARYSTTPERQALVSKVAPKIEELLRVDPTIAKGRGYIYGSFGSEKPAPTDMDLLIRASSPQRVGLNLEQSRIAAMNSDSILGNAYTEGLHGMLVDRFGPGMRSGHHPPFSSWAQMLKNESKARYGPNYDLIRLWGGVPIGIGLGDYAAQNVTPEETAPRKKGPGFLGTLKRPAGGVSTEISVGVGLDGKETEILSLVPTLNKDEIDYLLNTSLSPEMWKTPTGEEIMRKAIEHAQGRMKEGKSPYAQEGEQTIESRDEGGIIDLQKSYVVGGKGPELLIPTKNGMVAIPMYDPNKALETTGLGPGGYSAGQFVPQTNFIKLNHPESDKVNPKINQKIKPGDIFTTEQEKDFIKRCEWWLARELQGR